MVVLLSGGTGGAKLARGMLDVVGAQDLTVVANTADDWEVYGVHVSPDPDLVTYWLADAIDERGYGIAGDTWEVMGALERSGRETWFRLGDSDLAMCLLRTERLRAGARLTDAHAAVVAAMGVGARVLPMCDEPVATRVRSRGKWQPLQEYLILGGGAAVEGVELDGLPRARATPEVTEALAQAEAIVVGPSNPVISIGPILSLPGIRDALRSSPAPVVAVSPFVGGQAVKGPTELFCAQAGIAPSAAGIAASYGGLLDGLVADEVAGLELPALESDTLMADPPSRRRMAKATLEFAKSRAH